MKLQASFLVSNRKIVQEFGQAKQSLSSLIKNGLCITPSVSSAMLVMSNTPVAICSYALMDIKARPCQCTNTRIIDTQAGFRITIAIVPNEAKKFQNRFDCLVNGCYSLNVLNPLTAE